MSSRDEFCALFIVTEVCMRVRMYVCMKCVNILHLMYVLYVCVLTSLCLLHQGLLISNAPYDNEGIAL